MTMLVFAFEDPETLELWATAYRHDADISFTSILFVPMLSSPVVGPALQSTKLKSIYHVQYGTDYDPERVQGQEQMLKKMRFDGDLAHQTPFTLTDYFPAPSSPEDLHETFNKFNSSALGLATRPIDVIADNTLLRTSLEKSLPYLQAAVCLDFEQGGTHARRVLVQASATLCLSTLYTATAYPITFRIHDRRSLTAVKSGYTAVYRDIATGPGTIDHKVYKRFLICDYADLGVRSKYRCFQVAVDSRHLQDVTDHKSRMIQSQAWGPLEICHKRQDYRSRMINVSMAMVKGAHQKFWCFSAFPSQTFGSEPAATSREHFHHAVSVENFSEVVPLDASISLIERRLLVLWIVVQRSMFDIHHLPTQPSPSGSLKVAYFLLQYSSQPASLHPLGPLPQVQNVILNQGLIFPEQFLEQPDALSQIHYWCKRTVGYMCCWVHVLLVTSAHTFSLQSIPGGQRRVSLISQMINVVRTA
ncbi:hypothetical protein BDY19DRAFT_908767 [Irpex rosettiformis]|uniref:Uncharacterized protein n=1 Tax=Irpex rosettiformis TaxID=378272 RepID=A0ACB8TUS2_9APHY|nr:hypothetical protein BDY19DRAFT_908767 [Irpex rosettiformis]